MARERTVISPVSIEERKEWDLTPGNTVKVWIKVQEKKKTRLQAFEGLVLAHKHGTEAGATFTVRKISGGVGVEKIFPLFSPVIDHVDVLRTAHVRKAKLYYIREKTAKQTRSKIRQVMAETAHAHKDVTSSPDTESEIAESEVQVAEAE